MNVAIIPARSGSKRIKNKNIKLFFGKPIIIYVIKLLIKSKIFDKIIVSTDSNKIAKICAKSGAEILFKRPKSLADHWWAQWGQSLAHLDWGVYRSSR